MENMNPNYENPYSHTSGSVAENWFVESISPFSFLSVIYVFLILDPNECNSIYSSLPPQKTKTHLNCKPERFLHLHICSRWYVTPFIQQTIWNISPLLTADVSVKQKQDRMCAFTLNRLIMLWLKHVFFFISFFGDRHHISGVGRWRGCLSSHLTLYYPPVRFKEQISTGMHSTHDKPAYDLGCMFRIITLSLSPKGKNGRKPLISHAVITTETQWDTKALDTT